MGWGSASQLLMSPASGAGNSNCTRFAILLLAVPVFLVIFFSPFGSILIRLLPGSIVIDITNNHLGHTVESFVFHAAVGFGMHVDFDSKRVLLCIDIKKVA